MAKRTASSSKIPDNEILDPKYDEVFKKLFGSEPNEQITLQFIRDVTEIPVTDVTFLDPFVDVDVLEHSKRIVDVLCKTSKGDRFLIEIQRAAQKHFGRRILYYAAKVFSGPLKVGDKDFSKLKCTIVIAISENNLSFENPSYISKHEFVDKDTGKCEIDGIRIVTIDLSKFMKPNVAELSDPVDAWCFFLKYVYQVTEDDVHALEEKYPTMQRVLKELRTFKLSGEAYERYLIHKMEQEDTSEADPADLAIKAAKRAREEGREEGREEARKEAREEARKEGREEWRKEIARSLLSRGVSMTFVCECTGLKSSDLN